MPSETPTFRTVDVYGQNKLIAPVDLLILADKIILTVHPAAAPALINELKDIIIIKQRFLNIFRIFSKQAALQHLFNVLEPLAHDESTKQIITAFEQTDFDPNLL